MILRQHTLTLSAAAVAVIVLSYGTTASAANIASDAANDAAYDDGWQTGDNGGSGFGPWELLTFTNTDLFAGFFIGDSAGNGGAPSGDINTAGESFGLFANQDAAFAVREFTGGPLAAGQTFSLDFDNGFIGNSADVAFSLGNPFAPALTFGFEGGDLTYEVTDSLGTAPTLVPFTDDGLRVDVTLGPLDSYTLSVNSVIAAAGTLANADLGSFVLINAGAGTGSSSDAFFNSFAVTGAPIPEPGSAVLLALGGLALPRRRRV